LLTADLQRLSVSISAGAIAIDGETSEQSLEALLSRADAALYRAKLEGRNRLIIAEQHPGKAIGAGSRLPSADGE
jgi:GGDEF domain-containing protein